MKRTIITLSLVALASTALAQATPEITLPQYAPPSYHSKHGGTGLAETYPMPEPPLAWPSTPAPTPLPDTGRAGGAPWQGEADNLMREAQAACSGSAPSFREPGPCRDAFEKHMDFLGQQMKALEKSRRDYINGIGNQR